MLHSRRETPPEAGNSPCNALPRKRRAWNVPCVGSETLASALRTRHSALSTLQRSVPVLVARNLEQVSVNKRISRIKVVVGLVFFFVGSIIAFHGNVTLL